VCDTAPCSTVAFLGGTDGMRIGARVAELSVFERNVSVPLLAVISVNNKK
jgi:hypothetical protein